MEDESKIIEDILAGQVELFKILVEKYQNPVFYIILKIVGDYEDAKELTQVVFVKSFESLIQYKPQYKFFSWIYRIAINKALLFAKRKKHFLPIERVKNRTTDFDEPDFDADIRDHLLNKSIQELSEKYKLVILLKYYSDLSYTEIAETLNVSEKTVKSRLYDGRKQLKENLSKNDFFSSIQLN